MQVNIDEIIKQKPIVECKGRVYKARHTFYISTDGSINDKWQYRISRTYSCSGCHDCWGMEEAVTDAIEVGTFILPECPEDKALYRASVVNVSRDWESGIVDDWDIALIPTGE